MNSSCLVGIGPRTKEARTPKAQSPVRMAKVVCIAKRTFPGRTVAGGTSIEWGGEARSVGSVHANSLSDGQSASGAPRAL